MENNSLKQEKLSIKFEGDKLKEEEKNHLQDLIVSKIKQISDKLDISTEKVYYNTYPYQRYFISIVGENLSQYIEKIQNILIEYKNNSVFFEPILYDRNANNFNNRHKFSGEHEFINF